MTLPQRLFCFVIVALGLLHYTARGAELKPYNSAGCSLLDTFFAEEVWAKVAAESCLKCHKPGGDAARVSAAEARSQAAANRLV